MKNIFLILVIAFSVGISGQEYNKETLSLIGTFHTQNTTINGISFGAFPHLIGKSRFVKTNGIRLEIPGIGFLAPIGNRSPISRVGSINGDFQRKKYKFDEIINGINISTGTVGVINFNGLTIGAIAQFGILSNGIAIAGVWNAMNLSNGIQISGLLNETLYSNGIQISIQNSSLRMHGLQIGVFNFGKEICGIQMGLFNKSKKTKGIQIGLWNVNEKRKFPLVNWNFKD
jgi:hypothetical protein